MLTVCLCISAFTTETKLMCIDLTSYIVACNKKLKFKICVHSPDISKSWHRSKVNIAKKSRVFCEATIVSFNKLLRRVNPEAAKLRTCLHMLTSFLGLWCCTQNFCYTLLYSQGEKNSLLLHIIKTRKCKVFTLFLLESTRSAWALSFPALCAWGWSL